MISSIPGATDAAAVFHSWYGNFRRRVSFLFNRSLSAGRIPSALDVFLTVSSAFLFMLCIFALFALCALMMVFMMVHFYKNLVTDEGYLTFTLPVSPANILCSKLFTAFVWNILAWIAAFCAFVILFIPFMDIFSMDWDAILFSLRQLASTLNLFRSSKLGSCWC